MAHSLKLRAVAEGVETREQFEFLTRQQVDVVQGYLLGRPLPARETAILLRDGAKLSPWEAQSERRALKV